MKNLAIFILGLLLTLGCARVRVEAPEKPIKVDIAMRLDVYQHVQKDIDDIESIVSGGKQPDGAKAPGPQAALLRFLMPDAIAADELSGDVEAAALRRKGRLAVLNEMQARGAVGENNQGLVEVRNAAALGGSGMMTVEDENRDRLCIYESLAAKNGVALVEIQRIYSQKLQNNAPAGTPVQGGDGVWKIK